MNPMKIVRFVFFGSLIGSVITAWFSKEMITWWFAPPVEIAVNCRGAVEWGIDTYRKFMLVGAGLGAVLGAVSLFAFRRRTPVTPVPPTAT